MDALISAFDKDVTLKFAAALLALLNPMYGIPIFLSLTTGFTPEQRKRTALLAALTVAITGLVAALLGEEFLALFGIDVPSFRVAGGIIILGIALAMLKAENYSSQDASTASKSDMRNKDIAIVPLAIPLTIGPGTIATLIVFAHELEDSQEVVNMLPVILGVSLLIWVGLRYASPIADFLGDTVISVITRIMAIILAAIAVEMVFTGALHLIDAHYPNLSTRPGAG